MHEFSVMQSVVEAIIGVARERGATRVLSARLRVGELTFLNPDQLRFAFEVLTKGTIAEGAELIIETVRAKLRCRSCGYEGEASYEGEEVHIPLAPLLLKCPRCGSMDVELTSGRECTLASVRVEVPSRRAT